jgi:hypothetical protein
MGDIGTGRAFFMEREAISSRSVSLQGVFDCSQVSSDARPSTLWSRISSTSSTDALPFPLLDATGEIQHGNGENVTCVQTSRGETLPSTLAESNDTSQPSGFANARKNPTQLDAMCKDSGRTLLPHRVAAKVSLTTGKPTVSARDDVGDVGIDIGDFGRQGVAVFLHQLECHGISHCDPGDCHRDAKPTRCTGRNS